MTARSLEEIPFGVEVVHVVSDVQVRIWKSGKAGIGVGHDVLKHFDFAILLNTVARACYLTLLVVLKRSTSESWGDGYLRNIHHGIFKGGLGERVGGDLVHKLTVLMMILDLVELMDILLVLDRVLAIAGQGLTRSSLALSASLLSAAELVLLAQRHTGDSRLLVEL